MTTPDDPARLGALIVYCYRHERTRPGLRVVRRCAQRLVRQAMAAVAWEAARC